MPSAKLTKVLNKTDWQYSEIENDYTTLLSIAFDIGSIVNSALPNNSDIKWEAFKRWEYRPAPFTPQTLEQITARDQYAEGEWTDDISYNEFELAQALISGEICVEELIYANNIITRYLKAAEKCGKKPEWI